VKKNNEKNAVKEKNEKKKELSLGLKKLFSKNREKEALQPEHTPHTLAPKAPKSSMEIGTRPSLTESDKIASAKKEEMVAEREREYYYGQQDEGLPIHNEYYKGISNRYRGAKYITAVLLVALLVVIYLIFKDSVTVENLKYMVRNISSGASATVGENTVIRYDADPDNSFIRYKNSLCVIDERSVRLYNAKGKLNLSEKTDYESSIYATSEKYLLVCSYSGSGYSLYNEFDCVFSGNAPMAVYLADVSDNGYHALAGKSPDFAGMITIYNEDFKVVNKIQKTKYITALDLDERGKYVLYSACALSAGGEYINEITVLECGKTSEKLRFTLEGEIVRSLSFTKEGGFVLVSDKAIRFYSALGEEIKSLPYGNNEPVGVYSNGRITACIFLNKGDARLATLTLYSDEGEKLYSFECPSSVKSVDMDESTLLVLCRESILKFDAKEGTLSVRKTDGEGRRALLFGQSALLCGESSARCISFEEKTTVKGE